MAFNIIRSILLFLFLATVNQNRMAIIKKTVERIPATLAKRMIFMRIPKGTRMSSKKNTAIHNGKRYFKFFEFDILSLVITN